MEVVTVTQRQLLRDECLNALSNYVRQAQKTCALLGGMEEDSLSLDQLLAILAHTQAEDEIQKSYMVLRQRLFDLSIGAELHDPESQKASSEATRGRGCRDHIEFDGPEGV
jgi:hypothetical protein